MRLADYAGNILEQLAATVAAFEAAHPDWRVVQTTVTPRAVLKPMRVGSVTEVWVDLDEPDRYPVTDIPLTIVRRPGVE